MHRAHQPLIALLLSLAAAPAAEAQPRTIPGTPIPDTPDNRVALEVCDKYREAVRSGDADTVLRVVSPHYRDDAGTPSPLDDVDYDALKRDLEQLLTSVEVISYRARYLSLRRTGHRVLVEVEYVGTFRIAGREHDRRDRHVIELDQRPGRTLITSGL